MKIKMLCSFLLTLCFLIAGALPPTVNAGRQGKHDHEKNPAKEVYTGTAVAIGGQFAGNSRSFTLEITGYTPDQQAQQDFQILQTGGQDHSCQPSEENLGFSFEASWRT